MKDNKISKNRVWVWGQMIDHMTMVLHKSPDHDITTSFKVNQKIKN